MNLKEEYYNERKQNTIARLTKALEQRNRHLVSEYITDDMFLEQLHDLWVHNQIPAKKYVNNNMMLARDVGIYCLKRHKYCDAWYYFNIAITGDNGEAKKLCIHELETETSDTFGLTTKLPLFRYCRKMKLNYDCTALGMIYMNMEKETYRRKAKMLFYGVIDGKRRGDTVKAKIYLGTCYGILDTDKKRKKMYKYYMKGVRDEKFAESYEGGCYDLLKIFVTTYSTDDIVTDATRLFILIHEKAPKDEMLSYQILRYLERDNIFLKLLKKKVTCRKVLDTQNVLINEIDEAINKSC